MKNNILKAVLLALLLASSGCNAPNPPTEPSGYPPDVLVHCVYKYDSRYNIDFYSKSKVPFRSPSFPTMKIDHITDTNGKHWSVNEYEWDNYTCTPTTP